MHIRQVPDLHTRMQLGCMSGFMVSTSSRHKMLSVLDEWPRCTSARCQIYNTDTIRICIRVEGYCISRPNHALCIGGVAAVHVRQVPDLRHACNRGLQ